MMEKKTFIEKYSTPIGIIISACITVFGWYKVTDLNLKKDRDNKLLDIRNVYITNAIKEISYFNILDTYHAVTKEDYIKYERALKDIQIYGSQEEINMALEYITNVGNNKQGYSLDPLLNKLRNNLRETFGLPKTDRNMNTIFNTVVYPEEIRKAALKNKIVK